MKRHIQDAADSATFMCLLLVFHAIALIFTCYISPGWQNTARGKAGLDTLFSKVGLMHPETC